MRRGRGPMTQTEDEKAAKEYCDKEFQDVYDPWSEKRSFLAGSKHGREAERNRIRKYLVESWLNKQLYIEIPLDVFDDLIFNKESHEAEKD